ncbi:cytochrome b [Sulfurospirillum cavolei]|uniref:cytochrome b n=1 Tax=Sulfurospirillum cavolei TaxID=366522 RepID=UPI0007648B81|nr:cytochrome b/b6 domain-containing protein [Sulfurospirillum cavolei]
MTRYTSRSIFLHWLSGGLLAFLLVTGTFVLSDIPNTVEKLGSLKIHMILGIVATLVSVVRIFVIIKSPKPEVLLMSPLRAKLMHANHIAIYAVILAVGVSGLMLAQSASLGQMIFFGVEKELYSSFHDFGVGVVHGLLTKVLLFLVVMHIVGVVSYTLSHQSNIIKRMWF